MVSASTLPEQSLLHNRLQSDDFLDCYCITTTLGVEEAAQRAMAFPGWARGLLRLRNLIVAPLGLKTAHAEQDNIGPFPITERNEHELILGFDDTHLDFRISILVKDGQAYGATWVRRHNRLGRIYLATIMPFHKAIMRSAVRAMSDERQKSG